MVAPACLPLTVAHLPHEEELEKGFHIHSYETTIGSEMSESFLVKRPIISGVRTVEEEWAMAIMKVMVALRLAQGFQFVLQNPDTKDLSKAEMSLPSTLGAAATVKPSILRSRKPKGPAEILKDAEVPVFLSMSDQIHRIRYDPTGPSIRVERFVRKVPSSHMKIPYRCLIWPKLGGGYTECDTEFKAPDMELYGWNR